MGNILRLPSRETFTATQALEHSLQDSLDDVLICGYDSDGQLVVRSSKMTCAQALFLAHKMMRWAENGGENV